MADRNRSNEAERGYPSEAAISKDKGADAETQTVTMAGLDVLDEDRNNLSSKLYKLQAVLRLAEDAALRESEDYTVGSEDRLDWLSIVGALSDLTAEAVVLADELDGDLHNVHSV